MQAHGLNPRIRKSPFFERTIAAGATEFHPYNGMWMPVGYDSPINEYWNTVERAGLWDVSVQRIVEISGADAAAFVNLLTPRNIDRVAVGRCRYVVLVNQDGGILNDPVLLRIGPDRFWLSTADSDVYLWAKGISVYAGLEVQIETPDVSTLQVQGPASPRVIAEVFGEEILDLAYYQWTWATVDGMEVLISRTGFSSEVGFEIYLLGRERGHDLWDLLLSKGAPRGLSPGSPNRIRRIEGGVLDYGSDMTPGENPFEVGLERLIDFDKGCEFIGKQALLEVRRQGPRRKLVGALIEGEAFEKNNENRWPVHRGQIQVGEITSAVFSPRLQQNIGFFLADIEHAAATGLTVATPEGDRRLHVAALPFIDPDKKIPRAKLR